MNSFAYDTKHTSSFTSCITTVTYCFTQELKFTNYKTMKVKFDTLITT